MLGEGKLKLNQVLNLQTVEPFKFNQTNNYKTKEEVNYFSTLNETVTQNGTKKII